MINDQYIYIYTKHTHIHTQFVYIKTHILNTNIPTFLLVHTVNLTMNFELNVELKC